MDIDKIPEPPAISEPHPSPEALLLRIAIDKALMRSQRNLWYMYAYDKMRPAEIARKLKISKSAVSQRIKTIEKQLTAYCKAHMESYNAIKEAEIDSNDM
jgi:predicted DNA-binding protein YlxM (UPF0122 family)